jgi:hypothetical protein
MRRTGGRESCRGGGGEDKVEEVEEGQCLLLNVRGRGIEKVAYISVSKNAGV